MSQFFIIHPENPQPRLIKQAVKMIQDGGVVIYPTDSAYALGCQLANKQGLDRIRQIRQLDDKHNFTLVCRDLSEISTYATIDNSAFRLIKAHTPGPYTFILNATKEVPKRLMHPKRNTIGIRVPDSKILQAILEELNEPLMSVTLMLPEQEYPFIEAREIYDSMVIDLTGAAPKISRIGKGDVKSII
jgi:tRNA threonylcarbamoyl adenosine modification protein (Sua5/YciO/YrdC/YwlC family)